MIRPAFRPERGISGSERLRWKVRCHRECPIRMWSVPAIGPIIWYDSGARPEGVGAAPLSRRRAGFRNKAALLSEFPSLRIALIGPTYPFRGGIPHYTTLLYRELRKHHEVSFLAFKRQYPKWLLRLFARQGDRDESSQPILEPGAVSSLDSMNPASWIRTFLRIAKFRPDIVILPWWIYFWAPQFATIAWLVRRCTRSKVLYLCHNVAAHEDSGLSRVITRLALSSGQAFIVHSREDERNLGEMFPGRPIRCSFHPTYSVFRSTGMNREEARKRLGLEGNMILFFGIVRPYKGLKDLLEAAGKVLAQIDATVLVVGEFWERREGYDALIGRLGIGGSTRVVGCYVPNEDVEVYFSAADLVALPYRSATGSGVIQIAYGFEKPVVATRVGCLPEIVEDGRTGYLVPPGDPDALAQAIVRFFTEGESERMSQAIAERRERFSWEHMVKAIESLVGESGEGKVPGTDGPTGGA